MASPDSVNSGSTAGTTRSRRSSSRRDTLTTTAPRQSTIATLHKFTVVGTEEGLPVTLMFNTHEEMEGWVGRINVKRNTGISVIPMSPNPLLADFKVKSAGPSSSLCRPARPDSSPVTSRRFFAQSPATSPMPTKVGGPEMPRTPPRPTSLPRPRRKRINSLGSGTLTPPPRRPQSSRRQSTLNEFQLQYLNKATSPAVKGNIFVKEGRENWKDTSSCEICGSHFAILHRRHHCRSCSRCICTDCSINLYMPGVREKVRMCNRCEHEYTNQLTEINETGKKTSLDLAGRCHPKLSRLGVKPGKPFPTWRSYFRTFSSPSRPAVGRITVQVVEGMAFPAADANGKADPYCRVEISGYSRVPEKPSVVAEWKEESRYSMETTYVSATLCPVWRGAVMTLPIIRSSDAVLRLSVFDYDAIGSHTLLGTCEIPIEDLPLSPSDLKGPFLVDNWYEMTLHGEVKSAYGRRRVEPSRPVNVTELGAGVRNSMTGLNSAKELVSFASNALSEPIVLLSKLTGANLKQTRLPTKKATQKNSVRPKIRVKIKLCLNPIADVLSHTFLPPTAPLPRDKFDLQSLIRYGVKLEKLVDPHIQFVVSFVNSCRWVEVNPDNGRITIKASRDDVKRYLKWLSIYIIHVLLGFRICSILLHCYLFRFLMNVKIKTMSQDAAAVARPSTIVHSASSLTSSPSDDDSSFLPVSRESSFAEGPAPPDVGVPNPASAEPQLNQVLNWIAKKFGSKAAENVQNSLRLYIDLVEEFHSIYDGTDLEKTNACLFSLVISSYLIYTLNPTTIVLLYTCMLLFVVSPLFPRTLRIMNGAVKGVKTFTNRKRLLELYTNLYEDVDVDVDKDDE